MTDKEKLEELKDNIHDFQCSLEFATYLALREGNHHDAKLFDFVIKHGKYCKVFSNGDAEDIC